MAVLFLAAGWTAAQAPPASPSFPSDGSGVVQAGATGPALPAATANPYPPATAAPAGPGYPPPQVLYSNNAGAGFFYGDYEYLLWRVKGDTVPPVAIATPAGVVLTVNTLNPNGVLIGNAAPVFLTSSATFNSLPNAGDHCGFRVTGGYWFDCDRSFGLEASFFALDHTGSALSIITSQGNNTLNVATPFTTFVPPPAGAPAGTAATPLPIVYTGSVNAVSRVSESTWLAGGEFNARSTCLQYGCFQLGGLVGFRSLCFNDNLDVASQAVLGLNTAVAPLPGGTTTSALVQLRSLNRVRARNTFYGGQLGARLDSYFGRLFVVAQEKVGVGLMCQSASIDGNTTTTVTTAPPTVTTTTTTPGGILVGAGDVGRHARNRVAFVTETNLKLGWICTDWCRFHVGYDLLTISNVVRAGSVSGRSSSTVTATVAGTTSTVSLAQPSFTFQDTNTWAHGLNFGVEFLY